MRGEISPENGGALGSVNFSTSFSNSESQRTSSMKTPSSLIQRTLVMRKSKLCQSLNMEIEESDFQKTRILLRQGYLEKQGYRMRNWKLRYFQLYIYPPEFRYFEDKSSFLTKDPMNYCKDSSRSYDGEYLRRFYKRMVIEKESELNAISKAIKVVPLESHMKAQCGVDRYGIEIFSEKRIWKFRANSKADQEAWISAFNFVSSKRGLKFLREVMALENIISSINQIVSGNHLFNNEEKLDTFLTEEDASFVQSKLSLLLNLHRHFETKYTEIDDLGSIMTDFNRAINKFQSSISAVLLRAELHVKIAQFKKAIELESIFSATIEEMGVRLINEDKFRKIIPNCRRGECLYLDDFEKFEIYFQNLCNSK